jgi:PAS domain S-box-containing protein
VTEQVVGVPVDDLGREQEAEIARLGLLVESAGRLLATLDLQQVLPNVLELARGTLAADAYALWRRDPASDEWSLQAVSGLSDRYVSEASEAIRGNTATVSFEGPIVAPDISATEWLTPEHRQAHLEEGNNAFLAMPLRHGGVIIGTLVFYYRAARTFGEAELRSATAVASLASAAIGTVVLYRDQAHLARNLRFLAEAGAALASSLDYDATLNTVARLAVGEVADWCIIDIVEGPAIRRVALAASDRDQQAALEELRRRYPPTWDSPQPAARALREGGTVVLESFNSERLAQTVYDEGHLELMQVLDPRSAVAVPLIARGQTLGAITFAWSRSSLQYSERDVPLIEDIARRVALAVDNARLYQAERQSGRRLAFLAEAGSVLGSSLDYETTLRNVASLVVPRFANWCAIDALDANDAIRRIAIVHEDPELDELARRSLETYSPTADEPEGSGRVIRTGQSALYRRVTDQLLEDSAPNEENLRLLRTLGMESAIVVPLRSRARTLGALMFVSSDPEHLYEDDDLAFAEQLGRRAAVAVDNALLHRQSEEASALLGTIFGTAPVGLAFLDLDLRFARINRALAEMNGLPVEDHVGRKLDEMPRSFPSQLYVRAGEVLATGEPLVGIEVGGASLGGEEERSYEASYFPVQASGESLGVGVVVLDVTERRRAEEELAQRAHAALALAFIGDGVFLVDDEGVVRLWNTAASVITALPAQHVVDRRASEVVPGWSSIIERVTPASGPGTPRVETVPVELHGAERWFAISGVTFPGGTVYAFRDLTDEQRVERLKSEFVSTVSHELRTPLAAIYGAALTLRREEPALEAQREGLLDVIAAESDRLARIVNDVLWASRLESGTLHVAVESCNAAALATTVVEAARAYLPMNIDLQLRADEGDLPPVAADPDKVRQVLTNLVDNAVKYSPDGGTVLVEVSPRSGAVAFRVADEGLGIPVGEQERIFDKFYRLDPELIRGIGGTGLGLYITRELVRRMHGRVDVASREGEGSVFTVELPIAR